MTQFRYIAMLPILRMNADGSVARDDEGKALFDGYRLHHNAKLYEEAHRAKREANAWMRMEYGKGFGRVLAVDLDELPDADATVDQQYQFAERQMVRWAAEHGRLSDIVHGKTLDKSDRDYYVRVKRIAEWRAHATTELRRLLEMFKPPDFVIEVRREVPVHGIYERDKDGKYFQLPDRVWPFLVKLHDPRPDGSDANVNTWAETEGSAYAKMLAHLLDGRGFYPGT